MQDQIRQKHFEKTAPSNARKGATARSTGENVRGTFDSAFHATPAKPLCLT